MFQKPFQIDKKKIKNIYKRRKSFELGFQFNRKRKDKFKKNVFQ